MKILSILQATRCIQIRFWIFWLWVLYLIGLKYVKMQECGVVRLLLLQTFLTCEVVHLGKYLLFCWKIKICSSNSVNLFFTCKSEGFLLVLRVLIVILYDLEVIFPNPNYTLKIFRLGFFWSSIELLVITQQGPIIIETYFFFQIWWKKLMLFQTSFWYPVDSGNSKLGFVTNFVC